MSTGTKLSLTELRFAAKRMDSTYDVKRKTRRELEEKVFGSVDLKTDSKTVASSVEQTKPIVVPPAKVETAAPVDDAKPAEESKQKRARKPNPWTEHCKAYAANKRATDETYIFSTAMTDPECHAAYTKVEPKAPKRAKSAITDEA